MNRDAWSLEGGLGEELRGGGGSVFYTLCLGSLNQCPCSIKLIPKLKKIQQRQTFVIKSTVKQ